MARENQEILDRFVAGVKAASDNAAYIENTTDDGGVKYSVRDEIADDNGKIYNNVVLLDTNIFDGIKPRNWSGVLKKYVYNQLAGKQITVYDDNNGAVTIEFARTNERVQKVGAKNSHKVLDELARKRGIKEQLAVAHADEIVYVSEDLGEGNKDNTHQWLDDNGWSFRKATLMDRNGTIYEANLNIAHARDGRNILFDINKITPIGHGDVPSNSKSRGSHINTNGGKNIVSQKQKKNNPSTQKNQSRDADYLSAVNRGDMEAAQRMVDEAAKAAGLHQCRFSTNRLS